MPLNQADIQKLASLSRIKLSEEEQSQFTKEIDSILGYIEQIKEVSSTRKVGSLLNKNVLREDVADRDLNQDPEILVKSAPESEKGLIKVKKILN